MSTGRRLGYETHLLLLVLLAVLPAAGLGAAAIAGASLGPAPRLLLGAAALAAGGGAALVVRERIAATLRGLTTVVTALREGDFSLQAHATGAGDALGLLQLELNGLAGTLREQRLGALEAEALVRVALEAIDVPVLVVDDMGRVRLANRAAAKLAPRLATLAQAERTATALGLTELLEGEVPRTVSFPGVEGGPWELRRSAVRLEGRPQKLLVLPDLGRALREEERVAWQRLVRVLGHEINNSLAPMKSLAGNLRELVRRERVAESLAGDLDRGLAIIGRRAEALGRFLEGYARLARLPRPARRRTALSPFVARLAALEARAPVIVEGGPDLEADVDPDQLEQLLINLLRNAAEAVAASGRAGEVHIRWQLAGGRLLLFVEDDGDGLAATANLFVPFFTTKPGGSGIGLALCRQIAEAHGGTLSLENRAGRAGCVARLSLPL